MAKDIGADHFVVSTEPESMKARAKSLDLILNTVAANHQAMTYHPLLARDGMIVILGLTTEQHKVNQGFSWGNYIDNLT